MTTPDLELRVLPPGEADLRATAEVLNAAFAQHQLLTIERTWPDRIADELGTNARLIQGFVQGELVGTAMVAPADMADIDAELLPGIDRTQSLYFGMVAVRPDWMRQGIGRRLLERAEAIAREDGFGRVVLKTVEELGNVAYFRQHGFGSAAVRVLPAGYAGLAAPAHEHGMVKPIRPYSIRCARPEEASALAALINRAYEVELFFKNDGRTDEAEVAEIIGRGEMLVAENERGEVAGCVQLELREGNAYFGMLSVDPRVQGTGLGRLLIETAEARARAYGYAVMELCYVNLRQELPGLYRKMGYQEGGTSPFPHPWKLTQPAHMVWMSKRLRDEENQNG